MKSPPCFDTLASIYHFLEKLSFGNLLQWARTALMEEILEVKTALVIGDGDGRFLEQFLIHNSEVAVVSIDSSQAMLRESFKRIERLGALDRVQFYHADIRNDPIPDTRFDLVVTHFLLDCFTLKDLIVVLDRIEKVIPIGGKWFISDFAVPLSGWHRQICRLVITGMYSFFRSTTGIRAHRLIDPIPYLVKSGFRIKQERNRLGGFLVSQLLVRNDHGVTSYRSGTLNK
jgi:ubiquinone/menaquinone biosynthesis C-methylase UbiE